MDKEDELEVQQILELQKQIKQRLIQLGFAGDDDAMGNIEHHLAELSLWGQKTKPGNPSQLFDSPAGEKGRTWKFGCRFEPMN